MGGLLGSSSTIYLINLLSRADFTAFRSLEVLLHPYKRRMLNSLSTEPWYQRCTLDHTRTFLHLNARRRSPCRPNSRRSQASLHSVPGPIFLQSQACLPSVLGLSSLSPRSTFPCPRPIVPQVYLRAVPGLSFPGSGYLPAVPGLSSRSFRSTRLIFPQFRPIFPQSQSLSSPVRAYPPRPRSISPQSQAYLSSVPPGPRSSFASELSPSLPAIEDDGRCDLLRGHFSNCSSCAGCRSCALHLPF